jgi:P27 family predicted phage terminase small subunit
MTKPPSHHALANASHHPTAAPSRQLAVLESGTGVATVPPFPTGLKVKGKQAWTAVWTDAGKWLQTMDSPAVESFCKLCDQLADMDRQVRKDGLSFMRPIITPRGTVVGTEPYPHPLLEQMRKAEASLVKVAAEYALSPQSRTKLGLVQVQTASKFEQLLERQRQRQTEGVIEADGWDE